MPARKPELHFRRALVKTWTDDKGEEWIVRAALVFDSRGLRFTSLEIAPARPKGDPPAITTRVLQRLPLKKWTTEFAADKSRQLQDYAAKAPWAALPVLTEQLAHVAQGPRASSSNFYREVADVYTRALPAGSPTKAVADRWKVTRTLAATWVHRARKAGALSKTQQGRARG